MADTALVVQVPAAQARVGRLRAHADPVAGLGMPPHITVLYPFMPAAQIDASVLRRLRRALRDTPAFAFALSEVGRFEATAYLAPVPAAPFIALTQRLVHAFPDCPPYAGAHASITPHLTVAHGDAERARRAAAQLAASLSRWGPVRSVCRSIGLWTQVSGRWTPVCRIRLARAA